MLPRNMRPNSLSEPIAHTTFAAPPTFVAIDFETADYGRDGASAPVHGYCRLAASVYALVVPLAQITHDVIHVVIRVS